MSELRRDIMARISQVENERRERERLASEERARQVASQEAAERRKSEGERIAAELVELLKSEGVPTLPIVNISNGETRTLGHGWHVFTGSEYMGDGASMPDTGFGLSTDGKPLADFRPNTQYILRPSVIATSQWVQFFEEEPFLNGVASLIAGHGPYRTDRTFG